MRRKILSIIILVILDGVLLTGCNCAIITDEKPKGPYESTFVEVEEGYNYFIVYDKDTKVMYRVNSYSCDPLFNSDGSLKIWEE